MSLEIPSLTYKDATKLIKAMFLAAYEDAPALITRFANRVTDSARTISYNALGAPPRMREWLAERQPGVLNTQEPFPVTVRDWEASLEIPITELRADKLGQYAMKIRQMGAFAKQHPDILLAELIRDAGSTLCYDGQYMVDNDHSEGKSGTQDNLLSSSGTDTLAHIEADLNTGIAAMQRFKDDKGEEMNIGAADDTVWDVVCRPEDRGIFNKLATANQIDGTTNQWKGRIRVTSLGKLSAADEWYLCYLQGPVKPFIVQFQEEPSALQVIDSPESEYVILTGKAFYGTKGHYTVVPGDWRYVIKFA